MHPPKKYTARLEEKYVFNEKYTQFDFELESPHRMEFQSGQYVSVKVSETGARRSYSLCSSPDIAHGFQLLVDLEPGGDGSQFLQGLQFGQEIEILGPMGQFVLADNASEEATVMIATGSGIAPFRSMLLDLLQVRHDTRPVYLYWGMRFVKHLFWMDEFQELMDAHQNFHFHPVVSKPVPEWTLCSGRVTDCLSVHAQPKNAGYYLCGNTPMIAQTTELLAQQGVSPEHIHHEKFY
jgi:NAD(P)H-flavin reductase